MTLMGTTDERAAGPHRRFSSRRAPTPLRCRRPGSDRGPRRVRGLYYGGTNVLRLLFFLVPLVLSIYCIVEAISARDDEVRNLSKVWWILLVLFFPFVGSIAWLVAGRPQRPARRHGPHERSAGAFPEYDRPGRFAAADPAADEAFLKKVRERAEEQRRKAREQQAREQQDGAGPDPEGESGAGPGPA